MRLHKVLGLAAQFGKQSLVEGLRGLGWLRLGFGLRRGRASRAGGQQRRHTGRNSRFEQGDKKRVQRLHGGL